MGLWISATLSSAMIGLLEARGCSSSPLSRTAREAKAPGIAFDQRPVRDSDGDHGCRSVATLVPEPPVAPGAGAARRDPRRDVPRDPEDPEPAAQAEQ